MKLVILFGIEEYAKPMIARFTQQLSFLIIRECFNIHNIWVTAVVFTLLMSDCCCVSTAVDIIWVTVVVCVSIASSKLYCQLLMGYCCCVYLAIFYLDCVMLYFPYGFCLARVICLIRPRMHSITLLCSDAHWFSWIVKICLVVILRRLYGNREVVYLFIDLWGSNS